MDKRRIGVRAIIFHNGKLLANKFRTESGESKHWAAPGGGLDAHESLEEGLKREILEETGVIPKIGRLLFLQQFRSTRAHRDEELEFFFHITNPEDFMNIRLENTTHGAAELARCEFITPSVELLLPVFLQTIDIPSYIKNTKPVFLFSDL